MNESLKRQHNMDLSEPMEEELEKSHRLSLHFPVPTRHNNEAVESEPERKRARQTDNEPKVLNNPSEAKTTDKGTVVVHAATTEMVTDTDSEAKGNGKQKSESTEEMNDESRHQQIVENTTTLKEKETSELEGIIEQQQQQKELKLKQEQEQEQKQKQAHTDLSSTMVSRQELATGDAEMNDGTKAVTSDALEENRKQQDRQRVIVKQLFLNTVDQTERRYARIVAFNTTLALIMAQPLVCGREKKDDYPNFLAIGDLTSHKRAVSRKHFIITYDPDVKMFFIEVMSQNGLILDGHLFLDGKHPLHDNSVITVQSFTMSFAAPEGIIPPTPTNTTRLSLP